LDNYIKYEAGAANMDHVPHGPASRVDPPDAVYHSSPPQRINRSAAAVGESTAGRTSKKNTGSPVGSGGPE
jgi:hypothetical protein